MICAVRFLIHSINDVFVVSAQYLFNYTSKQADKGNRFMLRVYAILRCRIWDNRFRNLTQKNSFQNNSRRWHILRLSN